MDVAQIVIVVLMGACFLTSSVMIVSAVRALRREGQKYNGHRDNNTVTHTYRTNDPFWHMDDRGAHIELVDGQLWYWSDRSDHDGIST